MLEIMFKFIIGIITSVAGFYVLKNILHSEEKLFSIKTIVLLTLLTLPTVFFYQSEYNISISIITFLCTIVIYKAVFKLPIAQTTISVGMLMIIITFSDVIVSTIFSFFITVKEMRSNFLLMIITNLLVAIIAVIISRTTIIKEIFYKFINNTYTKKTISTITFLVLLILVICALFYNLSIFFSSKEIVLNNLLIMAILFALAWFYIKEENTLNKLNYEYGVLFNYVQDFEEWIEKEQLNRHELKNNLGVIRNMTNNRKIIKKIDEILNDSITIEESWIEQLNSLPKGILKGLLYYKMAIAQKNNIQVTTDVSVKVKKFFLEMTNSELNTLNQLMGIYLDNAIEASALTKKKRLCIEIYINNEKLNIVISNTIKKKLNINQINTKGYTTKGDGHGKGLHYAQKLLLKNKNFIGKQQIINDYYIQSIIVCQRKKEK